MPLFLEAKSAGDFTNVNKWRKEEAVKMQQLRNTYGDNVSYLFFCVVTLIPAMWDMRRQRG